MLLTYLSQKKKKILKLYPFHYVKLLLVSTLLNIPAVITAEMFTKGKNPVINSVVYIQNCSCSWLLLQLGHRNPILGRLTWYFFKKQQIKCSDSQHKTLRVGSYLYIVCSLGKGRFCWYLLHCMKTTSTQFLCARSCTANIFVYTKVCALAKCNLFQLGYWNAPGYKKVNS